MINLGKNREVLWDPYIVDTENTTAYQRLMQPNLKEIAFYLPKGVEAIMFMSILKDDVGYKLYYMNWDTDDVAERYLAVAESADGIDWIFPSLNIYPNHPELENNNIVMENADSTFVFYDQNPGCDASEKYKAIAPYRHKVDGVSTLELWAYTSADGYHFKRSHRIADESKGHFDSLNTAIWRDGTYVCYLRGMHSADGADLTHAQWKTHHIRDVRVMYSKDFIMWTEPKRIEYADELDYQMYTNGVCLYDRAPQILIGLPSRYCAREEWTGNTEQLASSEIKRRAMVLPQYDGKRSGLALSDCIFMCSRDGEHWYRHNEAFMTPGYETENNWVYGDCYPVCGLIDSGRESYYMYCMGYRRSFGKKKPVYRYEIRKDGFACYMAGGEECMLVTKPLIFEGKDLHLNFSTSAYGYVYVSVLDEEGRELSGESFELYGDTIDRTVKFADGGDFSEFAGKTVRLKFRMRDAKIFSFKFD